MKKIWKNILDFGLDFVEKYENQLKMTVGILETENPLLKFEIVTRKPLTLKPYNLKFDFAPHLLKTAICPKIKIHPTLI